jgi:hypothetical protein
MKYGMKQHLAYMMKAEQKDLLQIQSYMKDMFVGRPTEEVVKAYNSIRQSRGSEIYTLEGIKQEIVACLESEDPEIGCIPLLRVSAFGCFENQESRT